MSMPGVSGSRSLRPFIIVWIGQVVSILGSAMTGFGISIWLYEQNGQASTLTWAMVSFFAPLVLLSPIAGTLVDRGNRKLIMILSDTMAGLTTIIMLALLATGNLAVWHIYVLNFINGAFNSLQFPAFSAAITMIVPKEHYARVHGLMDLGGAASNIFAPALAAALLGIIGLEGILVIDVVTFVAAVGAVLLIAIPNPPVSAEGQAGQGSFLHETLYGFTYIVRRPSLLGLQLTFMGINLTSMLGLAVVVPMILARTGNNEQILGLTQSLGAIGGVLGGLALSIWGGPRTKVYGVLGGMLLSSLFGQTLMGLGRGLMIWGIASFAGQFFLPFINGSNQAIWQAKVAPDVQGRVFSVRRLFAQVLAPVATAVAGPLADHVFEPAMRAGGALSGTFGWLVGVGPGAGMSLMFILSGLAGLTIPVLAYLSPAVREAETRLPDHAVAEPIVETEPLRTAEGMG